MPSLEVNQLLRTAFDACDSRKAEDIRILALDPSESSLTDYFLICSGTNERQNVAISDEIEFRLKQEYGTLPNSVEGRRQGEWVLMDYVDFVVHIFMPERRAYYGLEQLRKSATSVSLSELDDHIKAALQVVRQRNPVTRKKARQEPRKGDSAEETTVEVATPATKVALKNSTEVTGNLTISGKVPAATKLTEGASKRRAKTSTK